MFAEALSGGRRSTWQKEGKSLVTEGWSSHWEVNREPSSTIFDLLVFNGENKSPEPPKTVRQVIHFFLVQVMIW